LATLPSPALICTTISLGVISSAAIDVAGNTSEIGSVGTELSDRVSMTVSTDPPTRCSVFPCGGVLWY